MAVTTPEDAGIYTFDQLLRQRAVDPDQTPLVAYPRTPQGVDDYELVPGATLDRFVDGAAKALLEAGLEPVYEHTVVALYGIADLDYLITVLGLGRLGYTSFLLSPRLPASAVASLLATTASIALLYGSQHKALAHSVRPFLEHALPILPILSRTQYDSSIHTSTPPFIRQNVNYVTESTRQLIILHSSGSTGLPKPINFTHKRLFIMFRSAQPYIAFQTGPLSHTQSLMTHVQAIYARKTLYLWNGHVAQTSGTLTKAIVAAQPELVWTVPYVLKLLAEEKAGIEALRRANQVCAAGSRCPDDLGDMLVQEGVNLGLTFGTTEVATLFNSLNRPKGDNAWNYLRPLPHVIPYLYMKPVDDDGACEAIVLDGHIGKTMSNSNDPPNSFHTSDLFVPHPEIHNAWKFIGRLDDRITLINGEKVLPLPIEGRIRRDALVREAVMFGIDRELPGVLLFRAETAKGLSDEEFLDRVWPAIEDANRAAEGFSQISREMVAVLGDDVECPMTDKASIKRAQVYNVFADIIDEVYTRLESSQEGSLQLEIPELEAWILDTFKTLGINIPDAQTDFFSAGVDSLKAIQMRGLLIRNLDLGGNVAKCTSMIVYDCGNVEKLAKTLYAIRMGGTGKEDDETEIKAMEAIIGQYSNFPKHTPHPENAPRSSVVVLTGATGSLGSHILSQLIAAEEVSKVYCLIRTSPNDSPVQRLTSALRERCMSIPLEKVVPLSAQLSSPDFNLPSSTFASLKLETTHIIHCAWEVNFALGIQSFIPQVQTLHNLLSLSLSVTTPQPAKLIFCSSIGTAQATPVPALIAEAPIPDLRQAAGTGYSRSKLVGERIVEAASHAGARATILRIGQIVPAHSSGSQLWNPNEAIPLIIRSAETIGPLPSSTGATGADNMTWIEADVLAKTIVELGGIGPAKDNSGHDESRLVYNLVHPHSFSWRGDFLPALQKAGLKFDTVSWSEWLARLAASEKDVERNPSRKLLGFWEAQGNAGKKGQGEVRFETGEAEKKSEALRNAPRLVDGDRVATLLEAWRKVW